MELAAALQHVSDEGMELFWQVARWLVIGVAVLGALAGLGVGGALLVARALGRGARAVASGRADASVAAVSAGPSSRSCLALTCAGVFGALDAALCLAWRFIGHGTQSELPPARLWIPTLAVQVLIVLMLGGLGRRRA